MNKEQKLEVLVKVLRNHGLRKYTCVNDCGYSQAERDIVDALCFSELTIGEKVFIPKGNAGKGITGVITDITPSDPKLYFIDDYNEALFEEELVKVDNKSCFTLEDVKQYAFWLLQWASKPENKDRVIHKSECDNFIDLNVY